MSARCYTCAAPCTAGRIRVRIDVDRLELGADRVQGSTLSKGTMTSVCSLACASALLGSFADDVQSWDIETGGRGRAVLSPEKLGGMLGDGLQEAARVELLAIGEELARIYDRGPENPDRNDIAGFVFAAVEFLRALAPKAGG